jgi:hypothetical protein
MSYLYHNKGVYKANGKSFLNKVEAILEANTSNTYVEWDYHDDVFKAAKWDVEPLADLDELYKQRAIQLREAYDHVVLFFSGGVDSWNVLNTFIKHDIKLDEIYIFGAFKAEEKEYTRLGADRNPGYYTREAYQSMPLVQRIADEKKIKISIFDWTDEILKSASNQDWVWTAGVRFDPTCMVRSKFHKIFREHNDMLYQGKKVGFVYGIDKPRLIRDNDSVYFAFLDVVMTTGATPTTSILGEDWEHDENFYWTPNFPELAIKQSHVIFNSFKQQNLINLIRHTDNKEIYNDERYYWHVNRLMYPDWNHDTWQIKKPTSPTYSEMCRWFFDNHLSERLQWESSLHRLEEACGKHWFNNNTVNEGIKGHLSPLYKISSYNQNN